MSHVCTACLRECDCWDGDNLGATYCIHEESSECEVRDDLRDELEFEDAHDDYGDWWDEDD